VRRDRKKNEMTMDFIERLFGVSPDGGDGSTELMYITALLFIVVLFGWRGTIRTLVKRTRGR
jgi:hypothetical protein